MFNCTTISEVHSSSAWKFIPLHMKTGFYSSLLLVQRGYAENIYNVWISCVIKLKKILSNNGKHLAEDTKKQL